MASEREKVLRRCRRALWKKDLVLRTTVGSGDEYYILIKGTDRVVRGPLTLAGGMRSYGIKLARDADETEEP